MRFSVDVDHMDLVIAFHIDDAAWRQIFDEKVVGHHQASLVARETQEMRS